MIVLCVFFFIASIGAAVITYCSKRDKLAEMTDVEDALDPNESEENNDYGVFRDR